MFAKSKEGFYFAGLISRYSFAFDGNASHGIGLYIPSCEITQFAYRHNCKFAVDGSVYPNKKETVKDLVCDSPEGIYRNYIFDLLPTSLPSLPMPREEK